MKHQLLIIEDEKNQANLLVELLNRSGYSAQSAESISTARKILTEERIDLVITDFRLPDGTGLEAINEFQGVNPDLIFVVITAHGDMNTAINCLKAGARDFLTKPVNSSLLKNTIGKLLESKMLVEEVQQLRRDLARTLDPESPLYGESESLMKEARNGLRVAGTDTSVLITGESGTGKELFANLIHYASDRRQGPFIKVNCSAIPSELVESELFGHIKGSFTGAHADKLGRFQAADGGTLFLDEIGELPLAVQAKLLRALQEKEFEPVGSVKPIKADVRFLFATNRRLEDEIKNGRFREDLFYRINIVTLSIPPLRERKEDISTIAKRFVREFNKTLNRQVTGFSSRALDHLLKYDWPGNIRELRNSIENSMVLMNPEQNLIHYENLPDRILRTSPQSQSLNDQTDVLSNLTRLLTRHLEEEFTQQQSVDLSFILNQLELKVIQWGLQQTNGKKLPLARLLSMDEKSIRYKLKKLEQ